MKAQAAASAPVEIPTGWSLVRHWAGGVRVRAAVVSFLVVGAAFVLSSFSVLGLLRGSLYRSASNTAQDEALIISSLMASRGYVPNPLPDPTEEIAAQVIGSNGAVIASSRNIEGQAAMVDSAPPPGKVLIYTDVRLRVRRFTHVRLDIDKRFVVAALGVRGPPANGTVLVAYSLGAADHAVGLVALSLGVALPVLDLLVGLVVWTMTGWSLKPVERIRSQVAKISATDLSSRVAEPHALDEVGQLARTMNDMLGRLQAASERQHRLIADVSHELRNPLAALQAQLEVAIEHPAAAATLVQGSIEEVTRMSHLVDDLLTLARIDEGMLRLRRADVDLDDIILAQADRLRQRGKVNVSLKGVSAVRVNGDGVLLERVVTNLADNAERYARANVEFSLQSVDGRCELSVKDDGPGVPWFERERIFERFVRLDSARAHEGNGAGLGLAIVREIVVAHGGDVWVEDAKPGAKFIVVIPLTGPAP
ncbi:MAG: sensor histidine kinase [Acidimicrobiales bacterium]